MVAVLVSGGGIGKWRQRMRYIFGRELTMTGFTPSSGEWEVDGWPLVVRNGQYFSLNLFLTLTPSPNPKFIPEEDLVLP